MRWRFPRRAIFARPAGAREAVAMLLRGYRVHFTLLGWVLAKWAAK